MNSGLSAIQHVVVLMFENRSFDHIFGGLPGVDGVLTPDGRVNPDRFNLWDPTKPPSPSNLPVYPTPIEPVTYQLPHDFNHDFGDGMMPDLFGPGARGFVAGKPIGAQAVTYPPTNCGFLSTIAFNVDGHPAQGPAALTFYEQGSLKVLHKLAQEFVLCDQWHCDMPGHTLPNRAFIHCATTGNVGIDDSDTGVDCAKTIFELIEEQHRTWKMYMPCNGQVDSRFLNPNVQNSPYTKIPIQQFAQDAANNELPFYSFLMCWSANTTADTDTSMHPASNIQPGENYLASVYNTLRQSPVVWENTLLIVTFDENGGMYDHVLPPGTVQPVPGPPAHESNHYGKCSEFDFTLLGARIPVLLISPWLKSGIDHTQYQNTSVLRFLEDMLVPPASGLAPLSLTARDLQAPSVAKVFENFGLPAPRTDCPNSVDTYPGFPFSTGSLSDPQCPTAAALPPLPHMVEITKEYSASQPGHSDSGKQIDREFKTNADLERYVQQRDQAAKWHYQGEHLKASLQIVENATGQWIWELRNKEGAVVAAPPNAYATRNAALLALDRVRFLLHEWAVTP